MAPQDMEDLAKKKKTKRFNEKFPFIRKKKKETNANLIHNINTCDFRKKRKPRKIQNKIK